jgi:TonB-like protein
MSIGRPHLDAARIEKLRPSRLPIRFEPELLPAVVERHLEASQETCTEQAVGTERAAGGRRDQRHNRSIDLEWSDRQSGSARGGDRHAGGVAEAGHDGADALHHAVRIDELNLLYGLDDEAVRTMRRWRFKPALLARKPVPVRISVDMKFALR